MEDEENAVKREMVEQRVRIERGREGKREGGKNMNLRNIKSKFHRPSDSQGKRYRSVLVRVPTASMKHYDQKQFGEERVYVTHTSTSLKEVSTGAQTAQELMQRPWRGAAYWFAQFSFLWNPGPPAHR